MSETLLFVCDARSRTRQKRRLCEAPRLRSMSCCPRKPDRTPSLHAHPIGRRHTWLRAPMWDSWSKLDRRRFDVADRSIRHCNSPHTPWGACTISTILVRLRTSMTVLFPKGLALPALVGFPFPSPFSLLGTFAFFPSRFLLCHHDT